MEREILYKLFDGTASFEEQKAVRQWMESSQENRKIFFKERALFDAILLLGQEKKVEEKKRKVTIYFSSLKTEILKIAVIISITLGISYFYQQTKTSQELSAIQTISVPVGQRINITLPDGTDVWLNAGTTLQYPVVFNKEQRQVTLNGEAYFDVAKNKKKPFIVQTSECDLEVLGTKFNIKAYSGKNDFEAALMEGSLKITPLTNPSQGVILTPGKKASLKNNHPEITDITDPSPYYWKEGLICFKNKPFISIMKEFEKYYGITIQVDNEKVLSYYYTGKFRQADGIDYTLHILQKDIQFTYIRNDKNQKIYIK